MLNIIFGIKSLRRNGRYKLNKKELTSENVLIYSFIFYEWLIGFKLLLPHEDEVLYNIKRFQTFSDDGIEREKEDLIYNIQELLKLKIEKFARLKSNDIINIFKINGINLYKTRYFLNTISWRERLKYLWNKNIYQRDDIIYNYDTFSTSQLFSKLINNGFSKVRHNYKDSNIVDSLVLCTLHEKLNIFKLSKGEKKSDSKLPIFYDSSGLFIDVIKRANLEDNFTCEIDGYKMSIIQTHDFFLLQTLFSKTKEDKPLISDKNYNLFEEFEKLTCDIDQKLIENNKIDQAYLRKLIEFINTKFIDVFWINQVQESVEFISDLKVRLNTDTVKRELEGELERILKEIKERVEDYSIFRNTFSTLYSALGILKDKLAINVEQYVQINGTVNIFRDFGLTRFSLHGDNCKELSLIIEDLFKTPDKTNILESHHLSNVGRYLTNGYLSQNTSTQKKLIIGIAVLWILEKYDLIIEILDKIKDFDYYSLCFFHAAALIKYNYDNSKNEKILNIMKYIEESHGDNYKFCNNYKTAIGASYIYYHLWEKNKNSNFLSSLSTPNPLDINHHVDAFLIKAINLAKFAINFLQADSRYLGKDYRITKYFYIINNLIYYISNGDTDSEFEKLEHQVNILERVKINHSQIWQYRFDDTLSLYYLRKSKIEMFRNLALSKKYIKIAKQHNRDAQKMVLTIGDLNIIKDTRKKIDEIKDKLYPSVIKQKL